jgi:MFS family permease
MYLIYLLLCIGSLLTIGLVSNYYVLLFLRLTNGIGASYVGIFCPVWIDQFCPTSAKSILMAVNNVSSVLGVILGFIMSSLMDKSDIPWNLSYLIQSFFLAGGFVIMLLITNKYFDRRLQRIKESNIFFIKLERISVEESFVHEDNDLSQISNTSNSSISELKTQSIETRDITMNKNDKISVVSKETSRRSSTNLRSQLSEDIPETSHRRLPYTVIFKSLISNRVSYNIHIFQRF